INISPPWFQQGQHPEMSALLKPSRQDNGVRGWLAATREQATILSGAVVIMHPEMYRTGREALVHLGQWAALENHPDICEVLMVWPSIYNVASIMVNWASPIHVDHFSRPQWMDLLVTFSNYTDLHFIIPSIHSCFLYKPGTVIALLGQLLSHGVRHTNGDHRVILYYMRDIVHEFVNVSQCNYMEYRKALNTF
ncbi:hypothetical protein V8E55_008507, partial [Tylopilus felleus]